MCLTSDCKWKKKTITTITSTAAAAELKSGSHYYLNKKQGDNIQGREVGSDQIPKDSIMHMYTLQYITALPTLASNTERPGAQSKAGGADAR